MGVVRAAAEGPGPEAAAAALELDATDWALIAELQQDGRAAYARLGELVNLSGDAVRERLRRLTGAGVVRVLGTVDPALIGFDTFALLGIKTTGAVEPVARSLEVVDEVDFLVHTTGAYSLIAEVVCRDELHLLTVLDEAVRPLPGITEVDTFAYLHVAKWTPSERAPAPRSANGGREVPPQPDDLDRVLMRELGRDGRASFRELSAAMGLPYSSVRRRVQRLLESGLVRITTVVDRVITEQRAMAGLGIRTRGPVAPVLQALAALPEAEIVVQTTGPFDVMVEVACPDRDHLADLVGNRIHAIDGVVSVETNGYLRIVKLPVTWAFPET